MNKQTRKPRIKTVFAALALLAVSAAQAAVTVSNVMAAQRPGTKLVDITYDVSSTAPNTVTVSLVISNDAAAVSAPSVSGAVGAGVATGTSKSIVWDMGADWNGNLSSNAFFAITADDGYTQTVSAPCPVAKTGQTASYRTGDDGDLETGVAGPNPRFTDLSDGTVKDNLTGLEWVQAPHSLAGNSGTMVWNSAIDFCNNLDYSGHSDWRLPSVKELESLVNCGAYNPPLPTGHPFTGVNLLHFYWSGTSYAYRTGDAWGVNMGYGDVFGNGKASGANVWPVRGGITQFAFAESASPVPKTGQTTSYRAGDDGELEPGVVWPNPRFTVITNGIDQTVIDSLTGLEWVQAPHSLPGNSGPMVWNSAIDFCNNLVYESHSDWRLPSRKELMSLEDFGQCSPSLPAGHPFAGVQYNYYRSGTSPGYYDTAWTLNMNFGGVGFNSKTYSSYYVWPVRGGQ